MLSGDTICSRATQLRKEAQFFAAPDGLGAAGGPKLVEGARAVCLDSVFGNEKLRGDLAIAETAGDQGEGFEFACRDAKGLLANRVRNERLDGRRFRGDKHLFHHDTFLDGLTDCFAIARDAETEPDAKGREEDRDERAVQLHGVLNDDEAVFGVLKGGDKEAADETEDEDVALHGAVRKHIHSFHTENSNASDTNAIDPSC